MKFYDYLKSRIKPIIGLSLLAAMMSALILPSGNVSASDPKFNFLSGDYELLRGSNLTKGESVWKDPVYGDPGDTFEGIVYYHNGIVGATANNTRIRVFLPSASTSGTAKLSATISAENASSVSDTVVDTQVIGLSGLTVNLSDDAELEYLPGTTKWFPETVSKGTTTPTPFFSGQSGDEIMAGDGVNLGPIQGCWEFAGFVTFRFRAKIKPVLSLDKTVRNVVKGGSFAKTADALANETVEFNLAMTNQGAVTVGGVSLRDALPNDLTYVGGSLRYLTAGNSTNLPDSTASLLFNGGWPLPNPINPGEAHQLQFRAVVPSAISSAKTVENDVFLTAPKINLSSNALVNLLPEIRNIERHKRAVNNTSGQSGQTFWAKASDEITYTLTTKNNGSSSVNLTIEDGIADILEYADATAVSDAGSVVDGTSGIDAKLVRYAVVTLNPGQSIDRTFSVKVKNPLPSNPKNGFSFDDQMYNKYGDEVLIRLERPVRQVELHVEKLVRNVTAGQTEFVDENEALAGDTLEYLVKFSNTGNTSADLVKFSDVLPPNTQYLAGTTTLSMNGGQEKTIIDSITGSGYKLDTIGAGESGYIKFRILTSNKIAAGEVLTNTITLAYSQAILSDTAKTRIRAIVPVAAAPQVPHLPVTGGTAASASFLVTLLGGIAGSYLKFKRLIGSEIEVIRIASDILKI